MNSIPEQFTIITKRFAQRPALKFKYHNAYTSITFATLQRRVETLSKGLAELGFKKGQTFAILAENRTEWVRADLAVLSLGGIVVPIHTSLSPNIIKHIVNDCQAQILLVSNQELFNKLLLVASDLSQLKTIVYIDLDHPEQQSVKQKLIGLDELMKQGKESTKEARVTIDRDDVASIIYTSGTTALPKGVMLTHRNFLFNAEAALTVVPVSEQDSLLSFLPLSHVFERTAGYYAPLILRGASIAYAESIKTLSQNLREVKPTILVSVPRVFEKMHAAIWDQVKQGSKLKRNLFVWALRQEPATVQHWLAEALVFRRIKNKLGGRFRLTICGGAALNHKLARFFDRIGIKIVEGYGLTEAAPVVSVNRPHNIKFGSVGQQLPGVEIEIAKDKELLVRGPNIMKGYFNNDKLTAEIIDQEGWLHTGDLAFMDDEGFITIIGRKKEMITLSNGKIVWPEQLELLLNDDKLISQSIVLGDGKSYTTALIIPDWIEVNRQLPRFGIGGKEPTELVNESELKSLLDQRLKKINEQLADWEKIKKIVLLPAEFSQTKDELTPTLKLRRKTIETNYKKVIETLY